MEKKPPNKPTSAKTDAPGHHPARHRFADNETTVMPLSEILRNRSPDPEEDEAGTQVGPAPSEFGQPTIRIKLPTPATSVAGKKSADTQPQVKVVSPAAAPASPETAPAKAQLARAQVPVSSSTRVATPPAQMVSEPTQMVSPKMLPQPVPKSATQGAAAAAVEPTNQVVVFFSCKGGAGATALSLNVAHHYAREEYKTCLVDMDLQLGDALAALALQPRFTIAQAIAMVQKGETVTANLLPKHASGVTVLSQVGSLDDLDKVSSEGMAALVEDLRNSYDVVVVDGVRDFSDNVLAVLDVADKIAIVTVQEVLAIRRARWSFNILRKIGFDPKDVTIVVNRFNATSEIPFLTIKRIFDPALVMTIPAETNLVVQSLNRGVPLQELNPQHTLTRNIGRLANNLVGNVVPEENEVTAIGRPSFWRRFMGK